MSLILPTAYFPNIQYFSLLFAHSDICISGNEYFVRQTLRNRCVIVNANGLQNLTVPVSRDQGQTTKTQDIRISYAEDWQKNHLRSIESAYRRTPYYEYYIEQIEFILSKRHELLVDLNFELLQFLVEKTGLACQLKKVADSEVNLDFAGILVNPKAEISFKGKPYIQTFIERFGFQDNLSILDLLFNEGPNSICLLENMD